MLHPDGKRPGKNWVYDFIVRNQIKLRKGATLAPARQKAINRPNIMAYFDKLEDAIKKFDIPPENIYNMDEKGCQLGGGRKTSREKYLYSATQTYAMKRSSDSLQLITIIETVNAAGGWLYPAFVLPGTGFFAEWFQVHDDIVCVF
ncbi:hypothetical protein C8F01DRAFT_993793 [Mycena amicta]|nr:hypothetical protein C8F01DRAFT_993793 [Mycena amicta]